MECLRTCLLEQTLNLEAAWSEDDSEGEPETAVGGERCGTEGVAYCHFPGCDTFISAEASRVCNSWLKGI